MFDRRNKPDFILILILLFLFHLLRLRLLLLRLLLLLLLLLLRLRFLRLLLLLLLLLIILIRILLIIADSQHGHIKRTGIKYKFTSSRPPPQEVARFAAASPAPADRPPPLREHARRTTGQWAG